MEQRPGDVLDAAEVPFAEALDRECAPFAKVPPPR
jgi:hypothetical protein